MIKKRVPRIRTAVPFVLDKIEKEHKKPSHPHLVKDMQRVQPLLPIGAGLVS